MSKQKLFSRMLQQVDAAKQAGRDDLVELFVKAWRQLEKALDAAPARAAALDAERG